jgi:hypothetical protein
MATKTEEVRVKLGDMEFKTEIPEKRPQRSLKEGEFDPELKASQARRRAARAYYHRNKKKLNARRKAYFQSPQGQFYSAKRRAQNAGAEWHMTFEEWWNVWTSAPKVFDLADKLHKPAYLMRGVSPIKNTQMCRKDTSKGWSADNVEIRYKLQPIPDSGMVPDWSVDDGRPLTWEEMEEANSEKAR